MMIRLVIAIAGLLFGTITSADPPDKLGKTAARKAATAVVRYCNATEDALACLQERGSECALIPDSDDSEYRCEGEISVTATRSHKLDQPPEGLWTYRIAFHVEKARARWRAKTKSIKPAK